MSVQDRLDFRKTGLVNKMPAAEFEVDAALVAALIADQFPQFAELPIVEFANGWDNVMFRVGDDLTARLPRRKQGVPLIVNEQRCLTLLADRLPIAVPAPLHHGVPSERFPMPWSLCPWLPGELAADVSLAEPLVEARRLGAFLSALHQPSGGQAPENPWRGHDIRAVEPRVVDNLNQLDLDGLPTRAAVEARWTDLASATPYDGEPMWLHGDLHAANMLVHDGAISAIIDFGDITDGDPAVDCAIAWMLFDADARDSMRTAALHVDDAMWSRAEAWALHFALVYLAHSADNPRLLQLGRRLLTTVAGT